MGYYFLAQQWNRSKEVNNAKAKNLKLWPFQHFRILYFHRYLLFTSGRCKFSLWNICIALFKIIWPYFFTYCKHCYLCICVLLDLYTWFSALQQTYEVTYSHACACTLILKKSEVNLVVDANRFMCDTLINQEMNIVKPVLYIVDLIQSKKSSNN